MNFTGTIKPVDTGVITVYQGADFYKQFTWKIKEVGDEESIPVDLTDATIYMQARKRVSSPAVFDFSPYIQTPIPTNGTFEISIPSEVTADMNFDNAIFQLEVHFPDSVVRLLEGVVELSREVVR